MPSLCNFDVSVVAMTAAPPVRLREYEVRLDPAPNSDPQTRESKSGQSSASVCEAAKVGGKVITSTARCYIHSTPNQHFRILVHNNSGGDACVVVLVDGEWVYSGLTYQPNHKVICFGGRLIDENTIQEMRFIDLDTTCTFLSGA